MSVLYHAAAAAMRTLFLVDRVRPHAATDWHERQVWLMHPPDIYTLGDA